MCRCGNPIPEGRFKYCSNRCMKLADQRNWREANRDKVKVQWTAYYEKNKERIREKARSPEAKKKDRDRQRKKRETDKEAVNRKQRQWYKRNKERAKANIYGNRRKRWASQMELEFALMTGMLCGRKLSSGQSAS